MSLLLLTGFHFFAYRLSFGRRKPEVLQTLVNFVTLKLLFNV